jgi:hypothetical protein
MQTARILIGCSIFQRAAGAILGWPDCAEASNHRDASEFLRAAQLSEGIEKGRLYLLR